jgi:flagellar protein FlgJ
VTQPLAPIGSGGVSTDSSRLASKENLEAAGKRFEAIFVGMMLKSMRGAKLSDGLFESKALDQFRDMQDQQLAQSMAAHAPIGIGKAMTEFLAKNAALDTGGGMP